MNSHQEGTDSIQETEFGGPALSKQKRIIHFTSGETLEEGKDDSEVEEESSQNAPPFEEPAERAKSSWKNVAILVARVSLRTCDFLGARLAGLLGLRAAKYQYAIDEHHRDQNKKTQSRATESLMEGQAETVHLSQIVDGSHYGATGTIRSPADDQICLDEKHADTDKGCHNKGYQDQD